MRKPYKYYLIILAGMALFLSGCKKKSLHEAVCSAPIREIERLIQQGYDVNMKNELGHTPLHEAAMIGRKDAAALLIDHGADINSSDDTGWTPLHAAAANSRWSAPLAKYLILRGADIHATTHDGTTVLHESMRGGDVSIVKLLIEKGLDVNARDKHGSTPLHYLVELTNEYNNSEKEDVIRILMSAGASAMVRDKSGYTPVESAISFSVKEMASLMASYIDWDLSDDSGSIPLHYAIRKYNAKLVELLLEHGADVNALDAEGHTPLYIATYVIRDEKIINLLKKYDGELREEPPKKTIISQEEFMLKLKKLVAEGGDVDKGNEEIGIIPLRGAATFGYKEAAQFLLENGADTEPTDDSGLTSLHSAVIHGHLEIAEMLIEHGANVDAKDMRGFTPLHFAVMFKNKSIECVKLLIENNANVNSKNIAGETPLKLAININRTDIIELLRKHGAKE